MTINEILELNKFEGYSGSNEDKWYVIKNYRNQLLYSCDWTQLPDTELTPQQIEQWKVYRQTLRDLTDIYTNPDEVVFPIEPVLN